MNHTAQDVLDAVNQKGFSFPFDLDDAQIVLDASPNRVKIRKCYFTWDDSKGDVTYHCPKEQKLEHNHPSDLSKIGERIKDMKRKINAQEQKPIHKTPKPK